jgi:hypothetical protein
MNARRFFITLFARGLLLFPGLAMAVPTATIAFQGFEGSGDDTWGYTPTAGQGTIATSTNAKEQTGSYSLKLSGSNSENTDPYVVFDQVDISGYSDVSLTLKAAAGGPDSKDDLEVWVSLDGGAYTQLGYWDGYSNQSWGFVTGVPHSDGNSITTTSYTYDVSGAGASSSFQLKILFDERSGKNNTGDHWYIDDITLEGAGGGASSDAALYEAAQTSSAILVSGSTTLTEVFQFAVQDAGSDGLATTINEFWIKPSDTNTADWDVAPAQAELYKSGVLVKAADSISAGAGINFHSLNVVIADGQAAHFSLKVALGQSDQLVDSSKLGFKIGGWMDTVKVDGAGSQFANPPMAVVTSNDSTLSVVADRLAITSAPATIAPDSDFALEILGQDAWGNTDADFTGEVTVSVASGAGGLSAVSGLAKAAAAGTASWSDLQYDALGDLTLSANATGLTGATSGTITSANTVDMEGWKVVQSDGLNLTLPAGVTLTAGGFVVIGRKIDQAGFEACHGALPANATYINGQDIIGGNGFPLVGGGKYYHLKNASGVTVDGDTPAAGTSQACLRLNTTGDGSTAGEWSCVNRDDATAGVFTAGSGQDKVVISEYADNSSHLCEFVEIYYDAASNNDTDSELLTADSPIAGDVLTAITAGWTPVFNFQAVDWGTADGLATTLLDLTLKPGGDNTAAWSTTLAAARLVDGTGTPVGDAGVITDADISFANLSFAVPDGDALHLTLEIQLTDSGAIVDESQLVFEQRATDLSASPSGSGLDAYTTVSSDLWILDVAATTLSVEAQPTKVSPGVDFGLIIGARDANGNLDAGLSSEVALSLTSGTGVLATADAQIPLTSGLAAWTDISYNLEESFVIQAAATAGGVSAAQTTLITSATTLDLEGWKLVQTGSSDSYVFGVGVSIQAGGYLVLGRSATQTAFESQWGVTLASNVTYVDAEGDFPSINGDEVYSLLNAGAVVVDGPTHASLDPDGLSCRRVASDSDGTGAADFTCSAAPGDSTPGSGLALLGSGEVVIAEFSDHGGTGNYVYEFIELYYDLSAGVPTDDDAVVETAAAPIAGDFVDADAAGEISVFRISVADYGSFDATSTRVSELVFRPGPQNDAPWTDTLAAAKLYNEGQVLVGTGVITADAITFSGLNVEVADSDTAELVLTVTLATGGDITDDTWLEFLINSDTDATALASGTGFSDSLGEDVLSGQFNLLVTGSELYWTAAPPALVDLAGTFALSLGARDDNGNLDADFDGDVSLETVGALGTLAAASGLTHAATAGVATWTDLALEPAGTYQIRAASTGLLSATSAEFTVQDMVNVGTVVISEIMPDPTSGCGADAVAEWAELTNATDATIDLEGWTFADDDGDEAVIPAGVTVPAYGQIVICAGTSAEAGVTCDVTASGVGMGNGGDVVRVLDPADVIVDQVTYVAVVTPGTSYQLDLCTLDASLNDDADPADPAGAWCAGTDAIACGDLGTPGALNEACGAACGNTCGDGAVEAGEQCDEAVGLGTGCTADCEYECNDPAVDCGAPPACMVAVCVAGAAGYVCDTAAADEGADCGDGPDKWCIQGACTANSCGDGLTGDAEDCDDGGDGDADDGCTDGCAFSCAVSGDCVDALTEDCWLPDCKANAVGQACETTTGTLAVADGVACASGAGTCNGAGFCTQPATTGDVIITEVMANPDCPANEANEWIEVKNVSGVAQDLKGWVIADNGGNHTIADSLPVAKGGVALLCRGDGTSLAACDYGYADAVQLSNSSAETLTLSDAFANVIDTVAGLSTSWGGGNGITAALDPSRETAAANDLSWSWCDGASAFDCGDLGSPGAANPSCGVLAVPPDAGSSYMTLSATAAADGHSLAIASVTLAAADGAPATGRVVSFTVTGDAEIFDPTGNNGDVPCDANGEATVYVRDGTAETVTVTATDTGSSPVGPYQDDVTFDALISGTTAQVATAGGQVDLSVTGAGAGFTQARDLALADTPTNGLPDGTTFPYGLLATTLTCDVGAEITLAVTLPAPLVSVHRLWKYGPTAANSAPHWYEISDSANVSGFASSSSSYTIKLTDGGFGDADGEANGRIVDPSGVGQNPADIPTLSEWAMILLMLLLVGVALRKVRGAQGAAA